MAEHHPSSVQSATAGTHDVLGHASADDQYANTPAGAGYEHTDAHVGPILKFMFWLAVAAVAIHFGLGLLFRVFVNQRIEATLPRYPLTSSSVSKLPPEPRLQRNPREDILKFRLNEEDTLTGYGWVDKGAGRIRIPIDDAIRLTLKRGLPVRPETTTPTPMPSDASGGR
jgi:hypothetical protein